MRYEIERLGDISGTTQHDSLDAALAQLQLEYPKRDDIIRGIADIVGIENAYDIIDFLANTLDTDQWLFKRQTPDPEDDRILIWEITDTGHRKVVWHFSGWHWNANEYGLPQGTLPGDDVCLIALALE